MISSLFLVARTAARPAAALSLAMLPALAAPGCAGASVALDKVAKRAVVAQVASAASVSGLRCEFMANPLGIDTAAPRLSWTIQGGGRGWMQSAYRIQVASSVALLNSGRADLWDSGKVASGQTLNIRYAGKELGSGARCFWRVQVWDSNGRASAPSAMQFWQVGLLRPSDWKAQWITAQTPRKTEVDGVVLPPPPFLRRTFTLPKRVRQATLFATARGVYEMRLNGSRVSDQVLAPGWTDYNKRVQYQAYDVTRQLKRGQNAIGAILGDGWHSGYVGFGGRRNHYGDTTALKAQLDVQFTDGTRQLISTDTSWQGGTGPINYSDMLMGESYDARKVLSNWDTARFSTSKLAGWSQAIAAPAPGGQVVDVTQVLRDAVRNNTLSTVSGNDLGGDPAYGVVKNLRVDYTLDSVAKTRILAEKEALQIPAPGEAAGALAIVKAEYGALDAPRGPAALVGNRGPAIRVTQQLRPVKITQPKPSTWIYDMGQNMVGVVRLKVRGAAGTAVKMRFAEMLNPDGTAYTANLRSARATDTYICSGKGEEIWEPRFTFHGFRYVEVTGFPGRPGLDAITGLVIGSDTPKTGTFVSSSPMVNQLQSNIDWGQRGNFLSVPTDCPQRDERLGWLGDAQVFVRTATYNRDVSSFFEKWMQDVSDGQSAEGAYPDVAPRKVTEAVGAPAWGDAGVIVPWTIYQAYADTEIINTHWDSMERWMSYIAASNPDGLWLKNRGNDFGDWLSIGADTPKDVLATAYYGYDASLMAKMARATNRSADAARYDALFEKIKSAFNTAFVSPDGRVKGNTQTAYLVALRFNLMREDQRAQAAKYLVDDIAAKKGHLSTGFVGVGYLCPVLSEMGYNDVAYKLLLNDTFPSWGYSIRQGATTIWERWDGWTEDKGFQDVGMNSFNHYSLGSVGEWLYRTVAGIDTDPNAPGFEKILIRPQPGPGLTFANASYNSIRGRIVSNWKKAAGQTTMEVTIPANTSATIYVPAEDAAQVREGSGLASASEGVKFVRQEGGSAVYQVGSGSYRFSAPLR